MITAKFALFAVLGFIILFRCSEYNPFNDESNARAVIISDVKDTLEIFDTKEFNVILLVRNLLKNCSVHVDKNRFFDDTCITVPHTGKNDTLKFKLSFYDTGSHCVSLTYERMDGAIIEQSQNVFVVNPLSQPDVSANTGDSVFMVASGVKDGDVVYYWSFPGEEDLRSFTIPQKWKKIRGFSNMNCFFKVSDKKMLHFSPLVEFKCNVQDNEGPVITCMNRVVNDTVLTNDINCYFVIRVDDEGGGIEAMKNWLPPDTIFTFDFRKDFVWLIKRVDTLSKPMVLDIHAKDGSSNTTNKRYWLRYDPDLNPSTSVDISIKTPVTSYVKKNSFIMSGKVANYYNTQLDSLYLILNGKGHSTLDLDDSYYQNWYFDVNVDSSVNKIKLLIKNNSGDIVETDSMMIYYDRVLVDTVNPEIIEISVNGQSVTNWNETVIANNTPVKLRIMAFDEGEGIRNVYVNNTSIIKSQIKNYIWETDISSLVNRDLINISVTDSVGLTTTKFIKVKVNQLPQLIYYPDDIIIGINQQFIDSIIVLDKEFDPVIYKLINENMSDFRIDSLSGKIMWTPGANDTLLSRILISYGDKYHNGLICTLNVNVVDPAKISNCITGIVSDKEFPDMLIADSQVLNIQLTTVPLIENKKLRYEVKKIPDGSQIKIVNGNLYWAPGIRDTGVNNITVMAYDTISKCSFNYFFSVNVLAKHRPLKINLDYAGVYKSADTYDLSDSSLNDTLTITVSDSDNVLADNHIISVQIADKTELKALCGKKTVYFLDAMTKKSGYDTLIISISDQLRLYQEKRLIYYGTVPEKPVIILPVKGEKINTSKCTFRWTGGDKDYYNKVSYSLYLAEEGNNFYLAKGDLVETECVAEFNKNCIYYCKIVASDGKSINESEVIALDVRPDNTVKFANSLEEFPHYIETDSQWSFMLKPLPDRGLPPYSYGVSSSRASSLVVENDRSNPDNATLIWIPTPKDTGYYALNITITDSLGNKDFLEPVIRVVPPNHPATLKCSHENEILKIISNDEPSILQFTIEDYDDFLIDNYNVVYSLFNEKNTIPVSFDKTFAIIVNPLNINYSDTLVVQLYERGKAGASKKILIDFATR